MNYDKFPQVEFPGKRGTDVFAGWDEIASALKQRTGGRTVVAVECYPGVNVGKIRAALCSRLAPEAVFAAAEAAKSAPELDRLFACNLTEDRVRGILSHHTMDAFFDPAKLADLAKRIDATRDGLILVIGTGSTLACRPDVLIYADLARWELQNRYRRKEITNLYADNCGEDFLRMYKRGFFIDWRVADRLKRKLFASLDFLFDANEPDSPRMMTGEFFREALKKTAQRPFRVVPYFDAGPWGGQWMKKVMGLDKNAPNFAWCFDCVPEENSLYIAAAGIRFEVPSIDLVFTQARPLLGEKVHARFGEEFPIRFDFLDTMQGGNLSLQVHPDTGYIQQEFGMHYTQDESYYMMDAAPDAKVYLGLKEDAKLPQMFDDLEKAQQGGPLFEAERYVNAFPAKKHDHFLIPAGTIHCSGANGVVLEISATPYIFTFKLWDWGRLGLDGKPRPIHIEHGRNVVNQEFRTELLKKTHVNVVTPVASGDGWREEKTGLHEREFIETRRIWFTRSAPVETAGSVNVLNLVEGDAIRVESPSGAFAPFEVHYAETFIVPAAVGSYTLTPAVPGKNCGVIKASVRI